MNAPRKRPPGAPLPLRSYRGRTATHLHLEAGAAECRRRTCPGPQGTQLTPGRRPLHLVISLPHPSPHPPPPTASHSLTCLLGFGRNNIIPPDSFPGLAPST